MKKEKNNHEVVHMPSLSDSDVCVLFCLTAVSPLDTSEKTLKAWVLIKSKTKTDEKQKEKIKNKLYIDR